MKNVMVRVLAFVIAFVVFFLFYHFVMPMISGDQSRQMAGYDN